MLHATRHAFISSFSVIAGAVVAIARAAALEGLAQLLSTTAPCPFLRLGVRKNGVSLNRGDFGTFALGVEGIGDATSAYLSTSNSSSIALFIPLLPLPA